jgi:hypothetical protein
LYTREEQALRILKYTSGRVDFDLLPPVVLSDAERVTYDELISTFVPDHPFLSDSGRFANVVFADYVRAFVAVAPLVGVHGASRAEILQTCPAPGPFFAGLVHSIALESTPETEKQEFATLDSEDIVDDLIKSYFSGSLGDSHFIYAQTKGTARLSLYRTNMQNEALAGLHSGISFEISNPSGVLELTSPLSRGAIATASGLVLQSISDEVELGPNFAVFADSLQIKARRLIALGDRTAEHEPGVFIYAGEIDHDAILTVHSYPREALQVASSGNLWHIWRQYIADTISDVADPHSAALYEVMIGARRILMSFRHTTTGDPSSYYEWLDRFGVGANPIFNAVLEGLIELGVVERDGSYYRLRLGKLASYGVNYTAVRGADFTSSLKPLTQELRKTDVIKRAIAQREGQ